MSLIVRRCSPGDLPALAAHAARCLGDSYEFVPLSPDHLAARLAEGSLRIFLAEAHGRLVGSTGTTCHRWGEEFEWLAVPASDEGRAAEEALRLAVEADPRAVRMTIRVAAGTEEVSRWTARGYAPEGGLLHAVAALTDAPRGVPRVRVEGIALHDMEVDEAPAVRALVNSVYGWERLAAGELESWTEVHPPFAASWIQVAEKDGRLVSALAARPDTESVPAAGFRGYLGPAATLPEWRGRGLAKALAVRALNVLASQEMHHAALHVHESNAPVLSMMKSLGFRVTRHWTFMVKAVADRHV